MKKVVYLVVVFPVYLFCNGIVVLWMLFEWLNHNVAHNIWSRLDRFRKWALAQ